MKKIIASAFTLAMLGSSVAFADADKLSAFQGIETSAVSSSELNQISGEGVLQNLLGSISLLNNLPVIATQLSLNGHTLNISTQDLLATTIGTADGVVTGVVNTVDGLVSILDPKLNLGVSVAGISLNTGIGAGL